MLVVQSAGKGSIILRYRDSAVGVSGKAKPARRDHLPDFRRRRAAPIADLTLLPLKMLATKSPVIVLFDAAAGNMPAYFAARWGVQTGGVSWLVADRELYGSLRGKFPGFFATKGSIPCQAVACDFTFVQSTTFRPSTLQSNRNRG